MEVPTLEWLKITGNISVERVFGLMPRHPNTFRYPIMGPTGAGKSSFIEALAGESQQLAGYTQTVNAYKVVNVTHNGSPVYLVDTPGFSGPKISEVEIMEMVCKWLKDNNFTYVHKILYLIPISETRLPGSRRRTIAMPKQLLGPNTGLSTVTFVTTMWDTLHNDLTRTRAESNFAQLRDQVFKDCFGEYQVFIMRFMNIKLSALEVLDGRSFYIRAVNSPLASAPLHLYQDLYQRIEGVFQAKRMIESELAQSEAQPNTEYRDILEQNQWENHETLSKFISQLIDFEPLQFGFHRVVQHLQKAIVAPVTPDDLQCVEIFQQWAEELKNLKEPVPDMKPPPYPEPLPHLSEKLALKGLLIHLRNVSKDRGSKWFKHRA